MTVFKIDHYRPFECVLEGSNASFYEVFVHFGVVICPATNSLSNVFIPEMPRGTMLRDGEKEVSHNNKISIEGRGAICLDIEVYSFNLFDAKNVEWRNALEDAGGLFDYLDTNFCRQDKENYFTENDVGILKTAFFTPLIPISPPIKRVSIKFIPISEEFSVEELSDRFNLIVDDHKLIPIAVYDSGSSPRLQQVLDSDYVFNFPFYYTDALKEDFLIDTV